MRMIANAESPTVRQAKEEEIKYENYNSAGTKAIRPKEAAHVRRERK